MGVRGYQQQFHFWVKYPFKCALDDSKGNLNVKNQDVFIVAA